MAEIFDLRRFQQEERAWSEYNFGGTFGSGYRPLLGAMEELGELAHAHLKAEQGIRTNEDHQAGKRDAIGDTIIYLCDYCTNQGLTLEEVIRDTWEIVRVRDWKKYPHDGMSY